ncbi:hypothetical protein BGX38DRAFT_1048964, partial [Terfezia claveryi]
PHSPPCVRCRRESKDCFFSATRRKARTNSATEDETVSSGSFLSRGGMRKKQKMEMPRDDDDEEEEGGFGVGRQKGYGLPPPITIEHHGHNAGPHILSPPHQTHHNQQAASVSRERLLQGEVYNSHDALHLLFEAAGLLRSAAGAQVNATPVSPICARGSHQAQQGLQHPLAQPATAKNRASFPQKSSASEKSSIHGGDDRDGMQAALKAWGKSRFVKSGWFTAKEAIGYVDYFFAHHHPLSPLLTTSYAQHSTHPALLQHEPFLATTLLAIASRYVNLPGPGGHSRSYAIHDMLWRELRRGLESVIWGGGGGGPPSRGGSVGLGNAQGKGLRTLGTVEALMVLTEWHVRNLHFPVGGEGGWGAFDGVFGNENDEDDGDMVVEGLGDRIENILEPAWRSDRMSWMLLGNALTLSYELGVFDDLDEPISSSYQQHSLVAPATAYRLRCRRIQKLLVVYVTQLASRLGWASMIPKNITDALGYKGQYAGSHTAVGTSPKTTTVPLNGSGIPIILRTPTDLQDTVFQCWVDLTMLMKYCGEQCFPSRVGTRDLMRSGKYVTVLENLRPILRGWKEGFEQFGFPKPIHNILTLEYEHVRMYINSLALQAIIDRCTTAGDKDTMTLNLNPPAAKNSTTEQPSFAVLMRTYSTDLTFITEVVDASRCVLQTVIERMAPTGELKHAPVRIYLRILSAAMFLLKTFALGAKEDDILVSLELMDQIVEVLRRESCDDVHLGLRFGELLETLTRRVRLRFVRMQGGSRGIVR